METSQISVFLNLTLFYDNTKCVWKVPDSSINSLLKDKVALLLTYYLIKITISNYM